MKIAFLMLTNYWSILKKSKELFFEKLIRLTIYLAVFFIPLICLPLNDSFIEYSKVSLFYVLIILAIFFWLLKVFFSKKIKFNIIILDVPIILLLFIYLLSSLFSIDRFHSFLGSNLDTSHALITILFLIIFYFLVSRFFYNPEDIKKLFIILNISIFLLLLFTLINSFWSSSFFLLFDVSINTLNFLLILSLILSGVIFFSSNNKIEKIFSLVCAFVNIIALYVFHNQIALLLLILSIFFFILFGSFKSQYFSNRVVVILTILLLLTVLALILPLNNLFNLSIPLELNLPNAFGWEITKSTLSDHLLLGVGPGNFSYSFYKYKPIEYNLGSLWQLGFEKNSNAWLEILNNTGILGTLLLIILFIKYFWHFNKCIRKNDGGHDYHKLFLIVGLTIIILLFIIFGFFNNYVFTIIFLFSLFLALASNMLNNNNEIKIFTDKNLINIFVYLSLLMLVVAFYYCASLIWADFLVAKTSQMTYMRIEDFAIAENNVRRAIDINSYRQDYKVYLANIFINKELYYQGLGQEYDRAEMQLDIESILTEVLDSSANKIDNFVWLKGTYAFLKLVGYQTYNSEVAINQKLLKIDPYNPELYLDRALLNFYIYSALKNSQEEQIPNQEMEMQIILEEIKSDLEKSIELKNNYALGYYNLGLYYAEVGEQDKSWEYIEKAFSFEPQESMIAESLKNIYIGKKDINKAIEVLNKYLEYNPKDINSLLELTDLYINIKEMNKAKEQIDIILQLDPENAGALELLEKI